MDSMFQLNSPMTVHIPTTILYYKVSALKTYKVIIVQTKIMPAVLDGYKNVGLSFKAKNWDSRQMESSNQFHVSKVSSSAPIVGANVIRHNRQSACGNGEIHAAAWKQARMKLI